MSLDATYLVAGQVARGADVRQFYNLFTGAMTDQPVLFNNRLTLSRPAAVGPSTLNYLLVTAINDTAVTAEAVDVFFNLARTLQFTAASAPTTQRAIRIAAPTYSATGAAVITDAATLAISGPPVAGTNMTLTSTSALLIESGGITFGTGGGPQILPGSGAPESSVTAPPGSIYLRTNGTVYRKASGTGNTGWGAVGGMTINSIQRGSIAMGTGDLSKTATITAVVTANSILSLLGQESPADPGGGAGSFVGAVTARLALTNTTTITATRGVTDSVTLTIGYQVVEWA